VALRGGDRLRGSPRLCGFEGERNEVESSPIVTDGKVFFGMDVNDREGGKGGFYAVDAHDGRLVWFFDLETGSTCRPLPTDNIRRFDGYHTEAESGLPSGFFTSCPGCHFDRTPTGCGNVWSSAAIDEQRQLVFFASSNCDTDDDPATPRPPPSSTAWSSSAPPSASAPAIRRILPR
jgi:glucose dehydrogenase